ncbi:hypothetical protein [Terrihabitans sp. B22-R8]|uniref:hypothetical protein n=1 Tax=Terrihabitans sp. B22-R8 TaxID=3425128 RepID=UPI00403C8CD9
MANWTPEEAADFIAVAEGKLRNWTRHAMQGWALFSSANGVLHNSIHPDGDVAQLASLYRNEAALMSAIRIHALFDRDADISFQVIKSLLRRGDVCLELIKRYSVADLPIFNDNTCSENIIGYLSEYGRINFDAFGNLQHFRNGSLVHISSADVERFITYNELSDFIEIAAKLAGRLSMLIRGMNDDHLRLLDDVSKRTEGWWRDAIHLGKGNAPEVDN